MANCGIQNYTKLYENFLFFVTISELVSNYNSQISILHGDCHIYTLVTVGILNNRALRVLSSVPMALKCPLV